MKNSLGARFQQKKPLSGGGLLEEKKPQAVESAPGLDSIN
jgi:hypothetical protein